MWTRHNVCSLQTSAAEEPQPQPTRTLQKETKKNICTNKQHSCDLRSSQNIDTCATKQLCKWKWRSLIRQRDPQGWSRRPLPNARLISVSIIATTYLRTEFDIQFNWKLVFSFKWLWKSTLWRSATDLYLPPTFPSSKSQRKVLIARQLQFKLKLCVRFCIETHVENAETWHPI